MQGKSLIYQIFSPSKAKNPGGDCRWRSWATRAPFAARKWWRYRLLARRAPLRVFFFIFHHRARRFRIALKIAKQTHFHPQNLKTDKNDSSES